MRTVLHLLPALMALAGGTLYAQEERSSENDEALPRYLVELIVFAHNDANAAEELLDRSAPMRDPALAEPTTLRPRPAGIGLDASTPRRPMRPQLGLLEEFDELRDDAQAPAPRLEFRLLAEEEFQLLGARDRMERLGAYKLLAHGGWLQDALPPETALPFDLATFGISNPAGTIKLHVTRFLHLTVDLSYQAADSGPVAYDEDPFSLSEVRVRPRYRLSQQRRARSGEWHYIDHPMFGLLFLVTPEPLPEEQEDTP